LGKIFGPDQIRIDLAVLNSRSTKLINIVIGTADPASIYKEAKNQGLFASFTVTL
jgi:hypothetical protein